MFWRQRESHLDIYLAAISTLKLTGRGGRAAERRGGAGAAACGAVAASQLWRR